MPLLSSSKNKPKLTAWVVAVSVIATTVLVFAQRPPMRRHTATNTKPLKLVQATEKPPVENRSIVEHQGDHRVIVSNGIPTHTVGQFPNRGNPNGIRPQRYEFRLPAEPRAAKVITPLHTDTGRGPPNLPFGIAVNGVLFDPGTAEYWQGDRRADWNYDALGGAVPLGIDENHAHVQPTGAYHYHGLPTLLLEKLGWNANSHSPQIGWAADGFPIYAVYGFGEREDSDSKIVELKSSYRLKTGTRPGGNRAPTGKYDGTFIQDYEYVEDSGDLDACNGRFCNTPEFPAGTYAYFLTSDWPVIPRAFRGQPINMRGPRHR